MSFWTCNWEAIGRATLGQLPQHERLPFIRWLQADDAMLKVYANNPGKVLRLWRDSIHRYQLNAERLPEGF